MWITNGGVANWSVYHTRLLENLRVPRKILGSTTVQFKAPIHRDLDTVHFNYRPSLYTLKLLPLHTDLYMPCYVECLPPWLCVACTSLYTLKLLPPTNVM